MENSKLEQLYPNNRVLTDEHGKPTVMVYFPKFYLDEVMEGVSHTPHPAFLIDGVELDGIYLSKFQNVVIDGLAYSLPDVEPTTDIDFDSALLACANKGEGFHMMTAMEWGAVALWCQKNGWLPFGNNDMGKDIRETEIVARIACLDQDRQICKVATGTGPVEWSHNRRADGIYDLNGNVWEWNGGIRLVFGELQALADNNAASAQCSQGADSAAWRAIDGRTGEWIRPNGEGTTKNSIKLDNIGGRWQYVTDPITSAEKRPRFSPFAELTVQDSICPKAQELLCALGCLPWNGCGIDSEIYFYANNGAEERMIFRGGRWGQGLNAGLFKTCMDDPRTYSGAAVGFRSAYAEKIPKTF